MNSVFLFLSLAAVFLSSISNASDPVLRADLRAWQEDFASDRLCATYLRKIERSGSLRDRTKVITSLSFPFFGQSSEYIYSPNGKFAARVTLSGSNGRLTVTRHNLATGEAISKEIDLSAESVSTYAARAVSEDGSTIIVLKNIRTQDYRNRSYPSAIYFIDFNEAKRLRAQTPPTQVLTPRILENVVLSPKGNHAALVWREVPQNRPMANISYLEVIENIRNEAKSSVHPIQSSSRRSIKVTSPRFASSDNDEKFYLFFGTIIISRDESPHSLLFQSHFLETDKEFNFDRKVGAGATVFNSTQNILELLGHSTIQDGMLSQNGEKFVSLSILNQHRTTLYEPGTSPVIHMGKTDGSEPRRINVSELSSSPVINAFLTRENRVLVVFRDRIVHLLSGEDLKSIWSGSFDCNIHRAFFNDEGGLTFLFENSSQVWIENTGDIIFGSPKTSIITNGT